MASSSSSTARSLPAGPTVIVNVERDPQVSDALKSLMTAHDEANIPAARLVDLWNDARQKWWTIACRIHLSGEHTANRHHVLDWPAFIREHTTHEQLRVILSCVFRDDHQQAKTHRTESMTRLNNARKALDLHEVVELHLEFNLDVCKSLATLKELTSLRTSTKFKPLDVDVIRTTIRQKMMSRLFDKPGPYPVPPVAILRDVNQAIAELKGGLVPKEKAPRKRKSASADEDDDDAAADPGPQPKRRRRNATAFELDREAAEELDEMGRAYLTTIVEEEEVSLLPSFFGDNGESIIGHYGDKSQLRSATPELPQDDGLDMNDFQDESVADRTMATIIADTHEASEKNDALMREKLELCSRLLQGGMPSDNAIGDPFVADLLTTLHNAAKNVLTGACRAGTLGHLESRKRDRDAQKREDKGKQKEVRSRNGDGNEDQSSEYRSAAE